MHQRTNTPYPDIILFTDLTFNRWLSFYRIDYILLYTNFLVILIIIIILITEARIISQTDGSRVIPSALNHIVPSPPPFVTPILLEPQEFQLCLISWTPAAPGERSCSTGFTLTFSQRARRLK